MISPETFKNIGAGLLSITTAVALPFCGIWISKAIKDREVQGKFVELSVSILRDKPSPETKDLREWAVKVINQYSGINLPQDLVSTTSLPASGMTNNAPMHLVGTYNENGGPINLTITTVSAVSAQYVVALSDGRNDPVELCKGGSSKPFTCELPKPHAARPKNRLAYQISSFVVDETTSYLHEVSLFQDGSKIGHISVRKPSIASEIELRLKTSQ